jgi:hypothetical protein
LNKYCKLPKNKRWLGHNTPGKIDGREVDVSQIAISLLSIFLDRFSELNSDSISITGKIARLNDLLSNGESLIEEIINDISVMVSNE